MNIGIDISSLHKFSKNRGIGFYAQNLQRALKKYTHLEVTLIEQLEQRKEVDVLHYPYFDLYRRSLAVDIKIPVVVTIHDVIPLVFPEHYPPGVRGRINFYFQKKALKQVSAIITDSETSKNDIKKFLGVKQEKVNVIYLAPDQIYKKINDSGKLKYISQYYKLPNSFLLYVGDVNWNKNLLNLAEAAVLSGVDLCLVGSGFEIDIRSKNKELKSYHQFLQKYKNNPLIHILGFVSDEDLVSIYNLAQVLMLPSFYEGFGLPILEAQSCGVPVITSKVSSTAEVGGDGAYLVDPNSVEAIQNAIKKVCFDKKKRQTLINLGYQNVKKYSWEKVAKQTERIYAQVL